MVSIGFFVGITMGRILKFFHLFSRDYIVIGHSLHLAKLADWFMVQSRKFSYVFHLNGYQLGLYVGVSRCLVVDDVKYLELSRFRMVCFLYEDLLGVFDIDYYDHVYVIVGSFEAKKKLVTMGYPVDRVLAIGLFDQPDDIGCVDYSSANTLDSMRIAIGILDGKILKT